METTDYELEKKEVEQTIEEWYRAATRMDLDSFMELADDDFVLHIPRRAAIRGKDEFTQFFHEYEGGPYGPVTLGDSWIEVSESGDMAYHSGTHHHVIMDGQVEDYVVTWKQLIVLKKAEGKWKLAAMSETVLGRNE